MVGFLIPPRVHPYFIPRLVTTLVAGLLIVMNGKAAETTITLNQGTNISVTAPATFQRMAFDIAGQIWLTGDANAPASPLTETGALNQRPAFSRDGRYVAFESLQSNKYQIFVTDIQTGVTRQVTFGPYDHFTPAWSPAGKRLAISSNRSGNFDLWELELDSLGLNQLTFTAYDESDPAWNDDGSRLAYVSSSTAGSSLYLLSPGDKPRQVLHEHEQIAAPAWRPGGGLLTYTRLGALGNQLRMLILSTPTVTKPITQHEQVSPRPAHWIDRMDFLYTADGKIRRRVLGLPTFHNVPFSVRIDINSDDARSLRDTSFMKLENRSARGSNGQTERPDGRQVVAALGDLWEFQRENGSDLKLVRQLTNDAFIDAQPAFSPDGQRLAFVSDRSGLAQIWILELDSLDMRRLTNEDADIDSVAWSPDGSAVAYLIPDNSGDTDGSYSLRLASMTGSLRQTLSATSRVRGAPVFIDGEWVIDAEPKTRNEALATDDRQSLPLSWRPADGDGRYIVRAGRIFDGVGPEYMTRQDIVIEDNLIVAIRPWSDIEPDTPLIDATTQTVIPGLIDLATRQEPADDERIGRKWLAAGVTSIRQSVDLYNQDDFDRAIERLESWSSGRRSGPRMMLSVRPCHKDSGRFDSPLFDRIVANAATLDIVAIELCPKLAGEELANTISRAHEHGLTVIATAPVPDMKSGADELRPDALLSAIQPDPAAWQEFLLVSVASGTSLPSRFFTAFRPDNRILNDLNSSWQYQTIFTAGERHHFDAIWNTYKATPVFASMADPNRILGAGGGIILGSESPSSPQGLGLHGEMRRLVAGSVQPFQVLKMASLDAARNLGYGESLGLIRAGRQADLVILDGDPLADIDSAANVVATIVNGRYYSRRDLTTPGLRPFGVGKFYNPESH